MYTGRGKLFTLKNRKLLVSVLKLWRGSQQMQLTFLLALATDMAASCMCVSVSLIKKATVWKDSDEKGTLPPLCMPGKHQSRTDPLTSVRHHWHGWLQDFCLTQKKLTRRPKLLSTVKTLNFHVVYIPYWIVCTAQDLESADWRRRWTWSCLEVRADKYSMLMEMLGKGSSEFTPDCLLWLSLWWLPLSDEQYKFSKGGKIK